MFTHYFTYCLMTTKEIEERIIDIKMDATEDLTFLVSLHFYSYLLLFFTLCHDIVHSVSRSLPRHSVEFPLKVQILGC